MDVEIHDDLGFPFCRSDVITRVVSLVPSLTEAIAVTRRRSLIAATEWCTHPADLDVPRVRGTKNPDIAQIIHMQPDFVVANMEENRALDVERLRRAGVPVWVTRIESVADALESMERLFVIGLDWGIPHWLSEAQRVWRLPPRLQRRRVAVVVWRDPWMVVGRDTFAGDLITRLGFDHVFGQSCGRYPHVALTDIDTLELDQVILPDEPYPFSLHDGPEMFSRTPVSLASGRLLTWYGPSLIDAHRLLPAALTVTIGAQ